MKRINVLAAALLVTMLTACATGGDTAGFCRGSSICPIVIYEKYPGVFAALPDSMSVSSDKTKNTVTLVWTFADQSKYKFSTKTSSLVDDGVELIDKNGAAIGLRPCFITNDSREGSAYAPEGVYLRCEITDSATFDPVRYRIRFHAADGSAKVVDPRVDSSGGADGGRSGPPIRMTKGNYQTVAVKVGDPVTLPLIGSSDGVRVIWDAGAGKFTEIETPMLFKDDANADVNFQPCRTTADPGGLTPSDTGQYYMCLITTAAPKISVTYYASYREGNLPQSKSSTMKRP